MAINYPGSLDDFTNPAAGNTLDSPSHSGQHSDLNDAVEALEAKVGIGASPAGSATAGQVLTAQGGGTAIWDNLPSSGGLVLITTESYTSATTVSLNDVFSSTYKNYRLMVNNSVGSGSTISLRLRASGSDNASNNYYYSLLYVVFSGVATVAGLNGSGLTSSFHCGINNSGGRSIIDLIHPFETLKTSMSVNSGNLDNDFSTGGGNMSVTTSYDGFSLVYSGSTTGSVSVYGYKQ